MPRLVVRAGVFFCVRPERLFLPDALFGRYRVESAACFAIFFGLQSRDFFLLTALHFLHLKYPGFSLFSDFPFKQLTPAAPFSG
jgi:hypothetical protein